MNQKVLKTLEYDKILKMLTECASSNPGKDLCRSLQPADSLSQIRSAQNETSDAVSRVTRKGRVSFSGVTDLKETFRYLSVGSALGAGELLKLRSMLSTAAQVKSFSGKEKDDPPDTLDTLFDAVDPLFELRREIDRCIISEDEIADDASAALKKIRIQIRVTNDRIHSILNNFIHSQSQSACLQDALITVRDGRYCVPVKAEYRGNVPGMIHDQSASGSTLFIEPAAVIEQNNRLRELAVKEQDEIRAVLESLSDECAKHLPELQTDLDVLIRLDFIFAKAYLSIKQNGSEPEFDDRKVIILKQARHPLLDPEHVVPVDLRLGDDFDQLIITGPNTGGKTVSLKTLGLLSLMGQAGLHIPARGGSKLGIFKEIYADIGDEQSIEQSLSTFSSHMVNIINILKHADRDSLILLDEIGAGTDPAEGAALAVSILTYLLKLRALTMATTHYSELKLFALSTERVQNACCEFDLETLKPTYRLYIGIPGKSNAFAISEKLGLSVSIIDDAKKRIDSENEAFEDIIAGLEQDRKEMEEDRREIAVYKSQIQSLKRDYEKRSSRLDAQREKIISDAKAEAREILKDAKDTADRSIRELNKLGKSNDAKEMEKVRSSLGEALRQSKAVTAPRKHDGAVRPEELTPGTAVRVLSMNIEGTILSPPDSKGNVTVQMGALKTRVPASDLVLADRQNERASAAFRTREGQIRLSKSASVSARINLIGKTVDEALPLLDKYLDDAYLARIPVVSVVHGKGTGALRKAVHNYLRGSEYVASYKLADADNGGAGVTLVTFKS